MKINIASPGRFHVLDLARELNNLGHDIRFYSFVPTRRVMKFGLPKKCNRSFFIVLSPILILRKFLPRCNVINHCLVLFQDYLTGLLMRKCDILIAMSCNYLFTLKVAKRKGAIVILERGSKHILEQKRILDEISCREGLQTIPKFSIRRELKGYEVSDYVSIAARHVKNSFVQQGFNEKKLLINPYGVDLSLFYKSNNLSIKKFDAIFVGNWSLRKGCDLIISSCLKELELKFLHVGPVGDAKLPRDTNFIHIDPVDQRRLNKYYHMAKVFVLPSREEGMALVQAQAIAAGLPIVCSKHTGGSDIGKLIGNEHLIFEMKEYTQQELSHQVKKALEYVHNNTPKSIDLSMLSWKAYGERYNKFISILTI
jgi:alpha-maltose-1-phosphate synthase